MKYLVIQMKRNQDRVKMAVKAKARVIDQMNFQLKEEKVQNF